MESMFTPLATNRLLIRRLELADAEVIFDYRSDPNVSRCQSWEPASVGEVRSFVEELSGIDPDTPGKWYQVGIVLRQSDQLIGDCGIHVSAADPRQVEVGITLAPPFQRRGLASEALTSILGFLFTQLGKQRGCGSVGPRNSASLILLRRVGMRKEAHLVESLWFMGDWADDVVFAILKREGST